MSSKCTLARSLSGHRSRSNIKSAQQCYWMARLCGEFDECVNFFFFNVICIDIQVMTPSWAWGPANLVSQVNYLSKDTSMSSIYLISAWFPPQRFIRSKQDLQIHLLKWTGIIQETNQLVTHAGLLLCDTADSLTWDVPNQSSLRFSDSGAL